MKRIHIDLFPSWENRTIEKIHINITIAGFDTGRLCYCFSGFGCRVPFPEYSELEVFDEHGRLGCVIRDVEDGKSPILSKKITFDRTPGRDISYGYTIYPRKLPENYRSSPYYDFRREPQGATGSALFSLILPDDDTDKYEVSARWDLSRLPDGCDGLFTFENNKAMTISELTHSFFIVGLIQREETDDIGYYWLSSPEFDMRSLAKRSVSIFNCLKRYFRDDKAKMKIIIRRDPFSYSGGGTAGKNSFLSGYSALGTTDLDEWENTLVHEMTHSWVHMKGDEGHHPLTWFNEGAVEYYCVFAPYRHGFWDSSRVLKYINAKTGKQYYYNPFRTTDEVTRRQIEWKDINAQYIPYGKGFVYLALVEYKLKKAGLGSIDDVIIPNCLNKTMTEKLWVDFIKDRLGNEGVSDFNEMLNGKLIVPPSNLFGSEFAVRSESITLGESEGDAFYWIMRTADD